MRHIFRMKSRITSIPEGLETCEMGRLGKFFGYNSRQIMVGT